LCDGVMFGGRALLKIVTFAEWLYFVQAISTFVLMHQR